MIKVKWFKETKVWGQWGFKSVEESSLKKKNNSMAYKVYGYTWDCITNFQCKIFRFISLKRVVMNGACSHE